MQKLFSVFICALLCSQARAQFSVDAGTRFLKDSSGKPFFWLGDTGWELFHRLTREEATQYLRTRAAQGYNVIQAVALAELDGVNEPNRYGDKPFVNADPAHWATTPGNIYTDSTAYDYWDNVDYLVAEAARLRMYVGLLPTWGDKVTPGWGAGPAMFNEQNAYVYAREMATRYKDFHNIIWILGGDRPVVYNREVNGLQQAFDVRNIWRAMARGIREVEGNNVFIAYHPGGSADGTTAMWPNEDWLSMHAFQSGHGSRDVASWTEVRRAIAAEPQKPVLDMEPAYEDHPVNPWDGKWTRAGRGFFSDYDVRARIYRSVFAGGAGVTYGHHAVWQFLDTSRHAPIFYGDTVITWQQALQAPAGAEQMKYLRELMESRRDWNTAEDSLLIAGNRGTGYKDLIVASRAASRREAMVYLPQPLPVTINLNRLQPGPKTAQWFNPATGKYTPASLQRQSGLQRFTPPVGGKDWVLVLRTT